MVWGFSTAYGPSNLANLYTTEAKSPMLSILISSLLFPFILALFQWLPALSCLCPQLTVMIKLLSFWNNKKNWCRMDVKPPLVVLFCYIVTSFFVWMKSFPICSAEEMTWQQHGSAEIVKNGRWQFVYNSLIKIWVQSYHVVTNLQGPTISLGPLPESVTLTC